MTVRAASPALKHLTAKDRADLKRFGVNYVLDDGCWSGKDDLAHHTEYRMMQIVANVEARCEGAKAGAE